MTPPEGKSMTDISTPGADEHPNRLEAALGYVPWFLASHVHVIWLMGLGVYLIVLPLCGVDVSAKSELIGGNYTNVSGDIGACIAAGGTLTLVRHQRRQTKAAELRARTADATHAIVADLYRHRTGANHPLAQAPAAESAPLGE
jgi:hypothetical protein